LDDQEIAPSGPSLTEPGRLASHVLLDVISIWNDQTVIPDQAVQIGNTALERLGDVGAVRSAHINDGQVEVDASDLIGGALMALNWLVAEVADVEVCSREDVVIRLREYLDNTAAA
jgi:hypothetical protein